MTKECLLRKIDLNDEDEIISVANLETGEWDKFEVKESWGGIYLTDVNSRSDEYNELVDDHHGVYVSYRDYITHVRQPFNPNETGLGHAVWESVNDLIEGLSTGNYYIG